MLAIELHDILPPRPESDPTYCLRETGLDDRVLVMAHLMSPVQEVLPVVERRSGRQGQQVALVLGCSAVQLFSLETYSLGMRLHCRQPVRVVVVCEEQGYIYLLGAEGGVTVYSEENVL